MNYGCRYDTKKTSLSEEDLQIAVKRRQVKSKGEKKRRYTHFKSEFQRTARRDKEAFLSDQCKGIEENKERLEIFQRKSEIPRENFMQDGLNKGQKWYGPNRSKRY